MGHLSADIPRPAIDIFGEPMIDLRSDTRDQAIGRRQPSEMEPTIRFEIESWWPKQFYLERWPAVGEPLAAPGARHLPAQLGPEAAAGVASAGRHRALEIAQLGCMPACSERVIVAANFCGSLAITGAGDRDGDPSQLKEPFREDCVARLNPK
jgi:hypothetical protein